MNMTNSGNTKCYEEKFKSVMTERGREGGT